MRFANRRDAGELLAAAVATLNPTKPVVYGLPRGGVPVAFEVAQALGCPLDVLNVAKVGLPQQPELALGAVANGGVVVANRDLLLQLGMSNGEFEELATQARHKLGHNWHEDFEFISPSARTAIVVDDGVATGATARAAVEVVDHLGAAEVWLAVPVAPVGFSAGSDELVVLHRPRRFVAVGHWYENFDQVDTEEVRELLRLSRLR